MNQKRKKWLTLLLSLLLLLCASVFTGCGGESSSGEPATCTIEISCATVLDHMEELKETKKEFVPEDGQILKKTTVSFTTGESVFDILKTICGEKGIQISSKYTPSMTATMWKELTSSMSWTAEKIPAGCTVSMGHFPIMGHLRTSQKTGM